MSRGSGTPISRSLADYPAPITVSGIRALDMAVRLKYAGVPGDQITRRPEHR